VRVEFVKGFFLEVSHRAQFTGHKKEKRQQARGKSNKQGLGGRLKGVIHVPVL